MKTTKAFKLCYIGMIIGVLLSLCSFLVFETLQKESIYFDCSQKLTTFDSSVVRDSGFDRGLIERAIEAIHESNLRKPQQETCKKRFPASIIIGVRKCGTRELLNFLHLHPHVELYQNKSYEMPFFVVDEYYTKGES